MLPLQRCRWSAGHRPSPRDTAGPSLATARHHVGVGLAVESRHGVGGDVFVHEADPRVDEQVVIDLLLHPGRGLPEDPGGAVAQRRPDLEHQLHVVAALEGFQEAAEQDVPALMQRPVEQRQEAERRSLPGLTLRQGAVRGGIEAAGDHPQLVDGHPGLGEGLAVELALAPRPRPSVAALTQSGGSRSSRTSGGRSPAGLRVAVVVSGSSG